MTNAGSISRLPVTLEISNKGFAQCEMIRHLSPLSVGMILKRLPLQDRVHKFADKLVYIETGLTIGAEKQKAKFKRGDMAYMTSNGSICIFIKDSLDTPMNAIGIVKSRNNTKYTDRRYNDPKESGRHILGTTLLIA
jgi:hypothetical protein